jgi:hypothetical protein
VRERPPDKTINLICTPIKLSTDSLRRSGDITGGRHAYSEDGITWFGGDVNAFNGSVSVEGRAGTMGLIRRERPELVHDEESGEPVMLISGVQGPAGEWSGDQTFTLVQEVDTGER